MQMLNSEQYEDTQTLSSLPQYSTTQQRDDYNIQQCEVRLIRDPLLIPKQEIGGKKSALSVSTVTATRQTLAEVFIEDLSSTTRAGVESKHVKSTEHKGIHNPQNKTGDTQDNSDLFHDTLDSGDVEEFVSAENAEVRTGQKQNNNDNVTRTLQNKYRCPICDDVCGDKFEFRYHMEFHQELHKNNDTVITEVNRVTKIDGLSENVFATTDSYPASQATPNIILVPRDETNNPKRGDVTEAAVIDISSSTRSHVISTSSQAIEEISSPSLFPTDGDANKIIPVGKSSSSIPKAAVKSGSSKSRRKKTGLPPVLATHTQDILKTLAASRTVPKIPIKECERHLKQLDTKCEVCTKKPKYACGNCKKEFKSYRKLKKHVARAHKSARFFCSDCGHGYDRISNIKKHVDRHRGLFACYLCTSSFETKQQFEQHIVTHRIKCDKCDKICANKTELAAHKLEVHKGVTYTCEDCNKTFNKYSVFKTHKIRHQTGEYKCKVCGKTYTRLKTYREHIYRHRKEKQVICEECGKEFGSVLYLKVHQKAVHLKKKYACNVCNQEFSTSTARTNCQNKHAGIKKYKCDMCDKAYFYDGSLIIHKRIHTGEKPYICFVCSRRFYSNQMLLKHCLSHGILEKEIKKRMKGAYQPEKQK